MQRQIIKEQIRKRVARSGNSGAVWVPKNWLGEEILVTRLETPKLSLDEELLNLLLPHLQDISGIYLYGSYARKEETKYSDIDVLVVAKKTFALKPFKRFDITLIEYAKIQDAVKKNPFVYALIHEAKPILNSVFLDTLRQLQPDFKQFVTWYKETTLDSIASTKELLELDKLESPHITSYSIIYSLLLRLKGIFLIQSLLNNKKFSNFSFRRFLALAIPTSSFAKLFAAYRQVRDNEKTSHLRIETTLADKLLTLLQREVKRLHA